MITTDEIQEFIPSKNIDRSILDSQMRTSREKYIRKFLGLDFYTELNNQYDNGTLTANNRTLLDTYIKPALANYVLFEAMPHVKSEFTSNGFNTPVPEYAQPATQTDYGVLRQKFLSDAEMYLENCREYLVKNSNLYPLYTCFENIQHSSLTHIYYTRKNSY